MKQTLNILLILLFTVIAYSCKRKELPEEFVNEPEFFVKGKVNGESINIRAGENGYYMFTSYHQDDFEIYNFAGLLKQKKCDNCEHAFQLSFKDNQTSKGSYSNISNSLQNGTVTTPTNEPKVSYEVKFNSMIWLHPLHSNGPIDYNWDFGDGNTSNAAFPTHVYDGKQSQYLVCLTITLPNNYTSKICNTVHLLNNCKANFTATNVNGNTFRFKSISTGVQPLHYKWEFSSDSSINANMAEIEYHSNLLIPVEKISLTITDATGCVSSISKNIVLNQFTAGGAVNFLYNITVIKDEQSVYNYATVDFEYNYNGQVYKPRPNASAINEFKMEVVKVSDYKENDKGEKTKKVEFVLNATLYNGAEKLELENVHGVFGVAYP
jgi:hypothetical protein